MWSEIKNILGAAAPIVGTLVGGPLGASVGALVASTLGVENTPLAIAQELKNNPEALVKIKQLESDERIALKKLAFKHAELESDERGAALKDTQNARAVHQEHWMPSALTICLALMVSAMFAALFVFEPPQRFEQVVIMISGAVLGAFGTSVAFWLGSSKGSSDKSKLLKGG